ncbi:RHS repeat-associated core domain-containing protein [uncultured Microbulbifer sp.]|uniref:RHS repeat-associated core domain-containing protein n=1 Tax=uncultured Microbulbifer sp. TaxID=348147 RepID=UPI00261B7B3E|nr:RHS repeat-associated core domain-containing protein [uncultured Microbulbifer sp.]
MQLSVENRQGVRYIVKAGRDYQMDIPLKVSATQLLSMFDDSVIQEIYDHFFGVNGISGNGQSASIQSSQAGTTPLPSLSEAPGHLSRQEQKIYLALNQNRLIIEEAPFADAALADKQSELTARIRRGLQQIIAQERAEAALIQQRHEQRSPLEKVGAYIDRGAKGVGNAAWGLAVWSKDILEVAALVHPLRQSIEYSTATVNYFLHDKSFEESGREYLSAVQREVVDVLGFDPSKITRQQLELALDVAQLIYAEPALRDAIYRFARDYVKAQHSLEITELAGSGAFEIILTIVLAAVTGGAGAVISLVKNARLLKAFRGIGELMLDFAKLKKQRSLLASKRGGKAKGSGANFSDFSSTDAAVPPSGSGPSSSNPGPASSGSSANKSGNQSSNNHSDGSSASAQNSQAGNRSNSSTSNESDNTNNPTGENHNGDKTQRNARAREGGEPINLKTGEERLTLVDAVLDGPLPFTLARTYRSSNPMDFGLGHGWTHTLGERLVLRLGKAVEFHDAEGRVISLPAPGGSGRSHNVVEQLSLSRVNDKHWIIAPYGAPNGVQKHFKATGDKGALKLAEIRDGYGNYYLLHYIGERLVCIESSLGEALHISPPAGKANSQRIGELKKETRDGRIKVLAHYEYSDEGDLIKVTDADGHSEQYRYHQHVIKQRTLKTGYRFHFEWDAEGPSARCVRQWGDPIGGQDTYNYQFDWDDDGKGVTVTDTRGGKERYRFNERALPIYHRNPEGAETLYSYNDLGQVTRVQLPSDDGSLREEIYQYDGQGRLVQKIDAAGNSHRIEYNSEGLPAKVTDPAGNSWQREYNNNGQVIANKDPCGNSTRYGYNPVGLIGSVTDPLGNTTRYLWNPEGNLAAVKDPMGRAQHYRYDGARRLEAVQHAPGQVTRYEYDAQDRIHAVTTPDGARTQYSYNPQGLLAEVTDSEGRSTCYAYDGLSQVKTRINPDGSRLEYHYDGERNLIGLTNENGERYQLKYDLNERLIEEVGFDGRVTRYAYNRAGHLVSSRAVTDTDSGKGIDTIFERDPFGRLLEETTPDGITSFRYNRSGQLIKAQNTHRKLRWEYDASGRVTADWQGKDKLSHQYDAAGNRIATTLPDGEVLNFAFNPAGQFQSVHRRPLGSDTDQLITSISHDEQGRESQRQHGNGLESQRDYDPQGRLQKLRLGKTRSASQGPVSDPTQGTTPILQRSYQYNKAGQIAKIEDSLRGTRSYHYDALDRLTQVDSPNPEYFVHDPAHNILAAANAKDDAKQQASATEVKGNRLAFRGDTHYRYDMHGNRIAELRGKGQKLQTRYYYNSRQQLVRVEKLKVEKGTEQFQQVIHYQYDPLGRRIDKADHGEQTHFLWDGDTLLREIKTDRQTRQELNTRTYYFEPGTFKPVALKEDNQLYHYHLDHLGTPDTLTNQEGEVVWSVAYKSYGNIALAHENRMEQPIRFQGQYFDEETGLHYNRFRYYDPKVGEFTQQDPIGLLGGVNNYQYVPNPVAWIDPFGLSSGDLIRYKPRNELTALSGSRGAAINRAWKLERELVLTTGQGTRDWSAAELELIKSTPNSKKLTSEMSNIGYTGHHINSVNGNGDLGAKWAGDPRNIVFLENENHPNGSATFNEHISSPQGHRGDYHNSSTGRLIDRQAMVDQYKASKTKDCP